MLVHATWMHALVMDDTSISVGTVRVPDCSVLVGCEVRADVELTERHRAGEHIVEHRDAAAATGWRQPSQVRLFAAAVRCRGDSNA